MSAAQAVAGTEGYDSDVERFLETGWGLAFTKVCHAVVPFLPATPADVLDVGAGAGQNAAALSELGYRVTAAEPLDAFRTAAAKRYAQHDIRWVATGLPDLAELGSTRYAFILIEAVWHHLTPDERVQALSRLSNLLTPGGRLSLSMRNGPAGMGTRVFPTSPDDAVRLGAPLGLIPIFREDNLPSVLPGKAQVRWSRLVLERRPLERTPL